MATAAPTDNRVYLYRLLTLNIDYGTAIVRNVIDDKCSNTALTTVLTREKRAINNLRANKAITKVQFDLLYPQSGIPPTTSDFDLTLGLCLLRNLKHFGLNPKYTWNITPQPGDTSLEADLCRLRMYRNELAHISSTDGIQETDFIAKWAETEGVLHRLNGLVQRPIQNLKQLIDDCKTDPLDPEAEKKIEKQIEKMRKEEEKLEFEMQNIKKGIADVTKEVTEVEGDVHTVTKDLHKLREDFKATINRVDRLEKQRILEGTQKRGKKPSVLKRILEKLPSMRGQKKEETETSRLHSAADDEYIHMKKQLKDDLIDLYRERHHTLPMSPLMEENDTPLLKFYVMPDIESVEIQRARGGGKEIRSKVRSLHDVFYKEKEPCRKIYLAADAGFGKTALSKRLVLTWCQAKNCIPKEDEHFKKKDISTMSNFDFVFLLSLRDCSEEWDIDEMIKKQIINDLAHIISTSDFEKILSKERCLIILDGLDEFTHAKSDIPHRKTRRKCTILTTTRPWKLGVSKIRASEIERKLELVGLSKTSARRLKRTVISLLCGKTDIEKHIQEFDRAISDRGISDLETIPLLLMYILCLWCDGIELGASRTELYCQTVELLLKRTFEKYPDMQQSRKQSQSDIPQCFGEHEHCKKHYTFLQALGQLAFEMLFSDNKEKTLVFSQSMTEKKLTPEYLKLSLNSGILTQSTEKTLTKQISKFSFSHKTVHEFFCALYISCQNESDVKNIVINKCKSLQSILDMSTVLVFISGMNTEIISSVSQEFLSVISEDKITSEYRSTTDEYCKPLHDIQDMYISCMKENSSDKELKLFCQDFFFSEDCKEEKYFSYLARLAVHNKNNMASININTDDSDRSLREIIDCCELNELFQINKISYCGKEENAQLPVLLDKSPKCVTVGSSGLLGSWSREMLETLQNNSLLQAIYIYGNRFKMSHDVLNDFLNYIINRKTMTEIRLLGLYCTEHERSCTFSLDFSQHSDLRELVLWEIPEVSQLKVSSQVEYVNLSYINLGEMSLPPEMANIESVYLSSVNMSASTLRDLVKVVEKLSHKVTVTIFVCEIEPETEFEHVIQYIRSSQNFRVTEDGSWWGKFVFETKVECSSTWSDTQNELVPMEEDPVCALHAYSEETSSNQTASLIPEEILRMDQNSIELYKRALSDGQEVVRSIRIMVVGHTNVGKTTLTKRLFYEDVDINQREITNGIDVHVRKCNVSLDTGHWTILGKDQKMKTIYHRLMKLLQKPASNDIISGKKDNVIETVTGEGKDIGFIKPEDMSEDDSSMSEDDNDAEGEISEEDPEPIATNEHSSRKDVASVKDAEGEVYEEVSEEIATEEHPSRKEEYIRNHLKELIEKIQEHSADDKDTRTAEVSLWDFAGQSEFYATHQVFLSKNAVYLLVTDISKDAEDIVLDNTCFIDSKGAKRKVSEFVHFWLNSIHEFCSSTECKGPPVILVGTHADKLKQETKDAAVDKFFYTIRRSLYDKATYCHLIYEDFAVDNSINDDQQIELLRQKIVNTAKNLPYWEKLIPANWITLEHIIVNLKDEGLKVLYKDRLYDMNRTLPVPIETENGVELFLKFHHESGNILYYRDENLINSIVIDPQWLIDAFKSLITSRNFCSKTQETFKKWIEFDESAILTPKLVEVIWKKEENSMFYKNKQLLLDYLEKLGLIARPVQESDDAEIADFYFAPCVLKTPPPEDLLAYSDCRNRRSTSKLCFTMASGFLPSIVFNKLLAVCISKWSLPKRNYKHLVFRGCGIFDLKDNHTLYVYFFDQVIQIWITKLSAQDEEPNNAVCSKVYDFISDFLQHRLRLSSGVKVSLKCQFSDLNSNDNLFPVDEIALKSEVVCNCRTEQHVLRTDEITQYWFPCIRKEGRVFGTFIDETGIEMTVFESHVIAKASYGICLIHYPCENGFGGGTGFRVGKRYIMTAAHVANAAKHGGLTNSMAIFNYLQDSPAWPKYVYSLTSVVFSDEETDVAVIKLAENSQMPPAFEHFIAPVENFNLIGHSKKDVMKINPVTKVFIEGKCPRLSDEISRTRSLSREHTAAPCDFEQFNSLTNKDRFLFHCKFTKGASGSPGIVLKGNNIHVTTVLVYGYPDWYYDPTQARLREIWPIKYCIEQGANMQSVCRNMFKADTQLCREIFGEFINCC